MACPNATRDVNEAPKPSCKVSCIVLAPFRLLARGLNWLFAPSTGYTESKPVPLPVIDKEKR